MLKNDAKVSKGRLILISNKAVENPFVCCYWTVKTLRLSFVRWKIALVSLVISIMKPISFIELNFLKDIKYLKVKTRVKFFSGQCIFANRRQKGSKVHQGKKTKLRRRKIEANRIYFSAKLPWLQKNADDNSFPSS